MKRKFNPQRDKFIDEKEFKEESLKKLKTVDDCISKEIISKAVEFVDSLNLPNLEIFLKHEERDECSKCKSKRKYFCSTCLLSVFSENLIPKIDLPIKLTIFHHEKERSSKSSALPLKVISKDIDVRYFPSQDLDLNENETLILYPHKDAKLVEDLTPEELTNIKNVVAIDCTWYQTNAIFKSFSKRKFKFIKLKDYETLFWRYQQHGKKCLSTCEAIYYFYKEYSKATNSQLGTNYDPLLFNFALQIHEINNKSRRVV